MQEDAVTGPGKKHQPQTTHLCFSTRVLRERPKDPRRCAAPPRPPPAQPRFLWVGFALPPGFRSHHVTSTKSEAPAESRDRGGIWDPEVRREGGERRKRGGGGRRRGRGRGGGRQVLGRGDAGGGREPVGSSPRAGRAGPGGRSSARLRGGAGRAREARGMSQGLPAAGSVLQRSFAAPGNQAQPQVVD